MLEIRHGKRRAEGRERPDAAPAGAGARDWAWLDGVTGPVDADFAAGAEGRGLSISAETLQFDADKMWVGLSDGRVIGVPLARFPRLARATPAEREGFG